MSGYYSNCYYRETDLHVDVGEGDEPGGGEHAPVELQLADAPLLHVEYLVLQHHVLGVEGVVQSHPEHQRRLNPTNYQS